MSGFCKKLVGWVVFVLVVGHFASAQHIIQVSPEGKNRSLSRARDEIRNLRAAGLHPAGGFVVELEPGIYPLSGPLLLAEEDSGTEAMPIVYRARQRGTAILRGGVVLEKWKLVSEPKWRKRLDPKAVGNVYCIDLPEGLLAALPGFANGGCGYKGRREYPLALYQGRKRLPISRWPNKDYARMGECLGENELHGHSGISFLDGWFRFDNDRLDRWVGEPDLWFDGLWFHHWADQKMALKALDPVARTIALQNPRSHAFGFKRGQGFFAFNAISEIDRPGEWAVDRARRRLYLWPTADLREDPPVVALCDTLVKMEKVSHVSLDGLVFEACRETAVSLRGSTDVTLAGCTLRHIGSWGVMIEGGKNCSVIGCDLYDLGEGGVRASGGERRQLIPGNHLVENNHIHHFGRIVSTYRPGVGVYGVGNKIRHNLIYQAQHQAISFSGNDHLIEYNIVHDVCLHSSDAGAIYSCTRNWTQRGTIIRHNLFHALGQGLDGCGCRAIYLDDYTSGTRVESNIVTLSDRGLNFGGGRDNVVEYNLAVNCEQSVNLASRGIETFAKGNALKGRKSIMFHHLLKDEKLFRSEPWRSRYPTLLAPLDNPDPADAHNAHYNVLRYNLNIGGGKLTVSNAKKVMRTCVVEGNTDWESDPGFVDLSGLDFRLRPEAPLFAKMKNFRAPDFARMGLYADASRATPPVKFGPGVSPMPPIMSPAEREAAKRSLPAFVPPASGSIKIDGRIAPGEWPALQEHSLPAIKWDLAGKELALSSLVRLAADRGHLYVAVKTEMGASRKASPGHVWGTDDAVEIALASVAGPRLPNQLPPIVLRGYADGVSESVGDGGVDEAAAARAFRNVVYGASGGKEGAWTAEWKIPLVSLGHNPEGRNGPILANISVYRSAEDSWASWRRRWSPKTWEVKGAYALYLQSLGDPAFIPGQPLPAVRIDIQGNRQASEQSMEPGAGTTAPDWARKWNRLVGSAGTVYADEWKDFKLEFTPRKNAIVNIELMGSQTRPPAATLWTYYDDFHIEGAELLNPDFEEVDAKGKPVGWNWVVDKKLPQGDKRGIVSLGAGAASGSRAAMVSHDYRVTQRIKITGGQKVAIKYKARAALLLGE